MVGNPHNDEDLDVETRRLGFFRLCSCSMLFDAGCLSRVSRWEIAVVIQNNSPVYIYMTDADTVVLSVLWMRRCGVERTVVLRIVC
jgi:hypothetical protein